VRTNIDIDDALMARAQAATGLTTKRETVERGLELLVQLGAQAKVRELRGKILWDGDLDEMRRDR
jgi:Arc/MetJ family transcription regulator